MIEYNIVPEEKLVYVKFTGRVDATMQLKLFNLAKTFDQYDSSFAIISDIRQQEGLGRSTEEIAKQMEVLQSLNIPAQTKHAYVVSSLNQVVWKDFFPHTS